MRQIKMVDLTTQHQKIRSELDQAIKEVIDSSAFVNGNPVKEFSFNLATFLKIPFVIPCANGTDALQLALMALNLKPGDEVIVPSFNYVSAAEVAALLGFKVVFADVEPDSFNISVSDLEGKISDKTKVVIVTHLFGQCADMEPLTHLCKSHGIILIEDAAQSIGAAFKFSDGNAKMAGTIGLIGITSFFPSKNLGCMGDGGAVFTSDPVIAEKIRLIANHGQSTKYRYEEVGVNSRLDTIQAAVLNVKFRYLTEYTEKRQLAATNYDQLLGTHPQIQIPCRKGYSTHVFNQYTIKIRNNNRELLMKYLTSVNVPYMIYYPKPLHLHTPYLKFSPSVCPVSEQLSQQVISLPIHTELDLEQQSYICNCVLNALE